MIEPEVAQGLLISLRWDVDSLVINHEGELVYLRAALNSAGERVGITDCCIGDTNIDVRTGETCDRHKPMVAAR